MGKYVWKKVLALVVLPDRVARFVYSLVCVTAVFGGDVTIYGGGDCALQGGLVGGLRERSCEAVVHCKAPVNVLDIG